MSKTLLSVHNFVKNHQLPGLTLGEGVKETQIHTCILPLTQWTDHFHFHYVYLVDREMITVNGGKDDTDI